MIPDRSLVRLKHGCRSSRILNGQKSHFFPWWGFICNICRHVILYNMNRFHDNTVFQIVEKYSTLLLKCHFCASFYNCCIMFLPKVCDTEILHRSNETYRHWKIMCHNNQPFNFMYQELACGVSCETMQGRDILRCFTHSKTTFDKIL